MDEMPRFRRQWSPANKVWLISQLQDNGEWLMIATRREALAADDLIARLYGGETLTEYAAAGWLKG